MISEVLQAIPWFWPATAAMVGVAALSSGPVARSLGTTRRHAFFLLVSVGGIIALTLTPSGHAGGRACHLSSPWPISIGEFMPLTERSLNVVLFVSCWRRPRSGAALESQGGSPASRSPVAGNDRADTVRRQRTRTGMRECGRGRQPDRPRYGLAHRRAGQYWIFADGHAASC